MSNLREKKHQNDLDNQEDKNGLTLRDKYLNSKGWKIYWKVKNLNDYKKFFDNNFLDLLKKIYEYKNNLTYFWAIKIDGSRNLDDFISDLARHLHNYLMSLYSLKDKTIGLRNHLIKKYDLNLPEVKYQSKLIEYKVDEHYDFLIELRHSFTHGIEKEGLSQITFNLDIKQNSGGILVGEKRLEKIITEYKKSTDQFYKWFFEEIQLFYSEDIKQTNLLIREENKRFGMSTDKIESKKEVVCWKCKKQIISNKLLGLLDENNNLLGYICDKCKAQYINNITQKLKCSKCENPLTNLEMTGYPLFKKNQVVAELFYKCNKCDYEGNISLKIGMREFRFK